MMWMGKERGYIGSSLCSVVLLSSHPYGTTSTHTTYTTSPNLTHTQTRTSLYLVIESYHDFAKPSNLTPNPHPTPHPHISHIQTPKWAAACPNPPPAALTPLPCGNPDGASTTEQEQDTIVAGQRIPPRALDMVAEEEGMAEGEDVVVEEEMEGVVDARRSEREMG
jgi:hypothetical protein